MVKRRSSSQRDGAGQEHAGDADARSSSTHARARARVRKLARPPARPPARSLHSRPACALGERHPSRRARTERDARPVELVDLYGARPPAIRRARHGRRHFAAPGKAMQAMQRRGAGQGYPNAAQRGARARERGTSAASEDSSEHHTEACPIGPKRGLSEQRVCVVSNSNAGRARRVPRKQSPPLRGAALHPAGERVWGGEPRCAPRGASLCASL